MLQKILQFYLSTAVSRQFMCLKYLYDRRHMSPTDQVKAEKVPVAAPFVADSVCYCSFWKVGEQFAKPETTRCLLSRHIVTTGAIFINFRRWFLSQQFNELETKSNLYLSFLVTSSGFAVFSIATKKR